MDLRNTYLQNQVDASTPGTLVIMLYDGLLKFAGIAREHVASQEPDSLRIAAENIDRCMKIVTELNSALDHNVYPELCQNLTQLYGFFIQQLSRCLRERDPEVLSGIIPLIENLRGAWVEADRQLQSTPVPAEAA